MRMESPLFVIPDTFMDAPKRFLVKDKDGNSLFITGPNDRISEETAIKWAIKTRGWMAALALKNWIFFTSYIL